MMYNPDKKAKKRFKEFLQYKFKEQNTLYQVSKPGIIGTYRKCFCHNETIRIADKK